MILGETKLKGAYIIDIEKVEDVRGFNARAWCQNEFEARGLQTRLAQINLIFYKQKGTLRGMHYQAAPHEEAKLIRCTRGALYTVIIDLRTDSPTYKQWAAVELTADDHRMLYIPRAFALGSQSLQDDTEITYHVSEFYTPTSARGIRYNDPAFGIRWPLNVTAISDKDQSWPDYPNERRGSASHGECA